LLSIAEAVQRIRPLISSRDEALSARETRRLTHELDELIRMIGFD